MTTDVIERLDTQEALSFLRDAKNQPLAVDTETNGKDIRDGRGHAVGISIAYKEAGLYFTHYFPIRHRVGENYGPDVLSAIKDVIETAPAIVFHNAKFDLMSLETAGIEYRGKWWCTMIMAHLINENYPMAKSLDECAKHYLGPGYHKEMSEEQKSIIDNPNLGWDYVPSWMMKKYAEMDAELPLRLIEVMMPKFKEETIPAVWEWKRRFIKVVSTMEKRGIEIDQDYCAERLAYAEQEMQEHFEAIGGFNPRSKNQMHELFCEKLGLPPFFHDVKVKDKDTGKWVKESRQTFNKDAMSFYETLLANMDNPSPLAEHVLKYRGWSKAATGFYGPYLRFLSPDGRLRPTYHHHKDSESGGTVTGRLSCSDPNLQQIPRKSDYPWNNGVKKSFRARKGYTLWEVDFSQLELRVATVYSDEESLIRVFNEDRDIFTEMAAVFQKTRDLTKKFVYMTQYAAGIVKIALDIGVSETVAQEMRDSYKSNYPGFTRIDTECKKSVKRTGKIRIWSGRYRHFRNPSEENHKGLNSLIQGGSADIVERQMVRMFEEIDQKSNDECRMLLTVHDSVWFEIKEGKEDHYLPRINAMMSDVEALSEDFGVVKFAVEAKQL